MKKAIWLTVGVWTLLSTAPQAAGDDPTSPPAATWPTLTPAAIQGAGHQSPWIGQKVRVQGVVTAVDRQPDAKTGDWSFWLQSATPSDQDPATSEAVQVRIPSGLIATLPLPPVVHQVTVVGEVAELASNAQELTVTVLVAAALTQEGPATLPTPTVVGRAGRRPPGVIVDDDGLTRFEVAADAIDFYESLESMWVMIPEPVVTGPTSRRGELVVLADGGRDAGPRTTRGAVLLRAGDDNPDRLLISPRLLAGKMPELAVGAALSSPLSGVLDYGFGNYRVQVVAAPVATAPLWAPDLVAKAPNEATLSLATFNVENLSARDSAERFDATARVIVETLQAPDLLALQEIQDDSGAVDDGVVGATATLEALVAAILRVGGPRYAFSQVDPENNRNGGQPGGNIRPAFLYQPARLELIERTGSGTGLEILGQGAAAHFSRSPARIDAPCFFADPSQGWTDSRKPLAAQFRFRGRDLFVVAAHLRSKRGDSPLFGAIQPPNRATDPQRHAQAQAIAAPVEALLAENPEAAVVVLGDMNDYEFRPTLRILGTALHDLVEDLPPAERYSYLFQGNAQMLDHILVSPALLRLHPILDVAHVHADFPEAHQASDHDPSLLRIEIP